MLKVTMMVDEIADLIKTKLYDYEKNHDVINKMGIWGEFGNITINLGRRTGHSTALSTVYKPYDYVITSNQICVRMLKEACNPYANRDIASFMTFSTLKSTVNDGFCRFRGISMQNYRKPVIFVDNASLLSQQEKEYVYKFADFITVAYRVRKPPIVWLG